MKNIATAVCEHWTQRSRRGQCERVTWKEKGQGGDWCDSNWISWLRVHILTSWCLGADRALLSGCSGNGNYVHRYVYSLLVILQTWKTWENRVATFHKYFTYTGARWFETACSWLYLTFFSSYDGQQRFAQDFFFFLKSDYKQTQADALRTQTSSAVYYYFFL